MTTANNTVTKMEQAREIVRQAFANAAPEKEGGKPRRDAIQQLMAPTKDGGLGMAKTAAATYFAHCITFFREQEQEAAMAKAEKGKPVYSAYKADSKGKVTSVGIFTTQKAAKAFNQEFRHDGVQKGILEKGQKVA